MISRENEERPEPNCTLSPKLTPRFSESIKPCKPPTATPSFPTETLIHSPNPSRPSAYPTTSLASHEAPCNRLTSWASLSLDPEPTSAPDLCNQTAQPKSSRSLSLRSNLYCSSFLFLRSHQVRPQYGDDSFSCCICCPFGELLGNTSKSLLHLILSLLALCRIISCFKLI